MSAQLSRRKAMQAVGAAAVLTPFTPKAASPELHSEGPDAPKICLVMGNGGLAARKSDEAGMRRIKQL